MRLFSRRSNKSNKNLKRTGKRLLLVSGCMMALFMMAPVANNSMLNTMTGTIEAQAAETYSDNWKMDSSGNWKYYLNDGSVVKDAWVQDHNEWYLLGSDGNMRTGIFKSNGNKYYLLDTVRNTGTYGKLLKNGMIYNGVTLKCDTSSAYEGALSQETINALRGIGLDFDSAPSVENTQHVSNGKVETNPGGGKTTSTGGTVINDLGGGTGGYTVPEKEVYVPGS